MSSTPSYGITEQAAPAAAADEHAERVRLVGVTVVDSGLAAADVDGFVARVDALLERQTAAAGGSERLADIGEQEIARACLAYDDAFLQLATNPRVLEICRLLLGDYFVLMQQNGIVNSPDRVHAQTAYHRDLPYQHFVTSRPLSISALFCIDPFTTANGATLVLPSSHKFEQFPSETLVRELERPVEAPAGSFIVFDSMLFHRAGRNTSAAPRRGVNHVFTLPFIAQQISFPAALGGRFSDQPEIARLLGYGAGPAASLEEWWERRAIRRRRDHV
jgi:ectoine hydroxylase-related dioxygenase (phytanoyl-CoA dioxygenase family)